MTTENSDWVSPEPAAPELAVSSEVNVERWSDGELIRKTDQVAEEIPVALVYHGVPHVVMLATPADLEDFAVGFTLSEGLVRAPDEIRSVEVTRGAEVADVRVTVAWDRFSRASAPPAQSHRPHWLRVVRGRKPRRTRFARCREWVRDRPYRWPVCTRPLSSWAPLQPINSRTGSVHAAAWVIPGKGIQLVREDVGRHNALDKTIGALVRSGADFGAGYLLITSRASFEMVQKTATVGISFLAALSAPTGFAVRLAKKSGLTLVAFARRDRHVVYANPERLG